VPLAAWCGVVIVDTLLRHRDYAEDDFYRSSGIYGATNWLSVAGLMVFTGVGWGLVTSDVGWLSWEGFLFKPLQLGTIWQSTGSGVIVALIGGVATSLAGVRRIWRQEGDVR
jgi:hypothetical protein